VPVWLVRGTTMLRNPLSTSIRRSGAFYSRFQCG
jgi:hypothetical protein